MKIYKITTLQKDCEIYISQTATNKQKEFGKIEFLGGNKIPKNINILNESNIPEKYLQEKVKE